MGGDTSGEFAAAIGFGSGSAPTVADRSLGVADTGAVGINIQELGLFANKTSVTLPGTTQPTPMLAHKTISPILFTSSMSLSGIWTLTF
jgi:hypothetical protein